MKRTLSMLLAICMIASFFVGVAPQAAQAADGIAYATDAQSLQNALNDFTKNEVVLSGSILLDKTISIPSDRSILIRSDGERAFIHPGSEVWPKGVPLLQIAAKADVTIRGITLDGSYGSTEPQKLAQGIVIENGGADVTLDAVSIFNCNAHTGSGAGLCVGKASATNPGTLKLLNKCVFWNNVTSMSVPTGGGAIYVNSGYTVTMERTEFMGNQAHSGGAMYVFNSSVLAIGCKFGSGASSAPPNEAGQRGGAIHCHGTMVLKDCYVANNISDQNGGGIYVSANSDVQGIVLLDNTRVSANYAMSSGSGVYISTDATLYIRGMTSVAGNRVLTSREDYGKVDDENPNTWYNNVFYNTTFSRIVLLDDQTTELGVSTANPADRKLAVYTIGDTGGFDNLDKRVQIDNYTLDGVDRNFKQISEQQKSRITYDSESGIWKLVDGKDDPEAVEKDSSIYHDGRLWLKLNLSLPDPVENQPYVVFDYNLPGTYILASSVFTSTSSTKGLPSFLNLPPTSR